MRRWLEPGHTFVDIGANLGFFSLLAAHLVGSRGAVWAFEPQPEMFESLRRSLLLGGLTNVVCFPMALTDHEGDATFYADPNGLASSLVGERSRRMRRYSSAFRVRADSLDRVAQRSGLDARGIRLVKVDVEGEEPRTIAGMLGTLEAAGCPPVWCEVRGPRGSTRAPGTYELVRERLAPLGYRSHRTDGTPLRPSDLGSRGSLDVLFHRPI
jgi:FkbM family methyltransferase